MNLRDLKYLAAVADKRHFGRAAEACHVSQPTLSAQIKKLEERLGIAIFERTNKSVSVTAIGEEILRHARRALEEAEQIEALAKTRGDPIRITSYNVCYTKLLRKQDYAEDDNELLEVSRQILRAKHVKCGSQERSHQRLHAADNCPDDRLARIRPVKKLQIRVTREQSVERAS